MKKTILTIAAVAAMMAASVSFASDYLAANGQFAGAQHIAFGDAQSVDVAVSESPLHIVQNSKADNKAAVYQPPVVAGCAVSKKRSPHNNVANGAAGVKHLISYPEKWARKGVYINEDGLVASCYAPRSATDYGEPARPENSGVAVSLYSAAGLWGLSPPG